MIQIDKIFNINKYETVSVYVEESHIKTINEMIEKYWNKKGL